MIPSLWSVEAGILSVHTLVLVTRTFLSIYVARLEGTMVKHIVRYNSSKYSFPCIAISLMYSSSIKVFFKQFIYELDLNRDKYMHSEFRATLSLGISYPI